MPESREGAPEGLPGTKIAGGVILFLVSAVIVSAIVSVTVMYSASHNLVASTYYTLSSMFGTNDEGYAGVIPYMLVQNSYQFYAVTAVLALDGLVKYLIIGFGIAVILDVLTGTNLSSKLLNFFGTRLKNHVLVCGYSSLAERLCSEMNAKGIKFAVMDKDPEKIESVKDNGFLSVEGDFTDLKDLAKANAAQAASIVFCSENDFTNLLGVVAARRINRHANMICRSKDQNTVTKMQRAGADLCVIPELLAGLELGQKLSGV
jgi:hypothetical protein